MRLEKKAREVPDIMNLPKPSPARAGLRRAVALAVLAVLLVGGAAFWLTRDPATREQWRQDAATAIDGATQGTPLAGAGDLLRDAPPPPPLSVLSPATAPGTLAGQNVQGTVGAPGTPDAAGTSGASAGAFASGEQAGQPEAVQPAVPKVTEDSRVRPQFVEDLAAFLVSRFKPGPRGGELNVSVQGLNQRYGARLTGVSGEGAGGREALLRYAFHPTMLQGLYGLYADRFLESVNREAGVRGFDPEQTRQLHMVLAGRFVMLAGALEGVAAVSDLSRRLRDMEQAAQSAVGINAQMAEAVFAMDQLREDKAAPSQLSTAQLRVDGLSARYRRALEERAAVQRSLLAAIRQGGGQALDDDGLLFVAQWVDRRLRQDPQTLASVQSAASVLRDLARRGGQAASGAAAPAPRPPTGEAPAAHGLAAPPQEGAPGALSAPEGMEGAPAGESSPPPSQSTEPAR